MNSQKICFSGMALMFVLHLTPGVVIGEQHSTCYFDDGYALYAHDIDEEAPLFYEEITGGGGGVNRYGDSYDYRFPCRYKSPWYECANEDF